MCGICGIVYLDKDRRVESKPLKRMASLLTHRGPDGEGIELLGQAGLSHRRLSIIDLVTGAQPMFNEDQSLCLVFNGEIYNFYFLRKELLSRGHIFKTRSDTEVLLHLYEEKGDDCLSYLRGMFAFALWDSRKLRLLLARDRFGKKPLYYLLHDGAVCFASEMKALLSLDGLQREIRYKSIHDFLTYQCVPAPETIFKNIYKLRHGHCVVMERGRLQAQRQYWKPEFGPKLRISEKEALERCDELISESVKLRLESDVPLGAFLSGGIDSSLVVAFMRRHVTGDIHTFSIGFEDEQLNELEYARQVADRFETKHTEFVVKADGVSILPKLVWHFDEPFADPAALPTFYLSQMTRKHVTVALNGDGGDELFGGYERFQDKWFWGFRALQRTPTLVRRHLFAPGCNMAAKLFPESWLLTQLAFANEMSLAAPEIRYAQRSSTFRDWMKERLYTPEFIALTGSSSSLDTIIRYYRELEHATDLDRMIYAETMISLPELLLQKVDRTTMAVGLEGRSPLLDQELMTFAARLPDEYRINSRQTKYLLRKLIKPLVPSEVSGRRKHGFVAPLDIWFRGEARAFIMDLLLSDVALSRGFFKREAIEAIMKENERGQWNQGFRIWALACLELWFRTFFDNNDARNGPVGA